VLSISPLPALLAEEPFAITTVAAISAVELSLECLLLLGGQGTFAGWCWSCWCGPPCRSLVADEVATSWPPPWPSAEAGGGSGVALSSRPSRLGQSWKEWADKRKRVRVGRARTGEGQQVCNEVFCFSFSENIK
jgi:hypothetical protein